MKTKLNPALSIMIKNRVKILPTSLNKSINFKVIINIIEKHMHNIESYFLSILGSQKKK